MTHLISDEGLIKIKYTSYRLRKRLLTLILLITFLFAAIIGKLIYIEIITADELQAKALDQWTRDIPVTGERGNIFDVNGILLADTMTTYTVYARPIAVKNKFATASALARVLGINFDNLYNRMNSKVSELTVKKKVSKDEMSALVGMENVTGVYYSPNIERFYPYGDFMTQILGFANIDGEGQTGVEAYYNKYLKGANGYILTETDLVGRELGGNVTHYVAGKKGSDVYLTVDYTIQSFVEEAVKAAFAKYNAQAVSCIVMNVKTGAITAMAQSPSYDLNNVPRDNLIELFGNSKSTLVSNVYEQGSTFKILTAAMGLEAGVIDRNYHFFCPGNRIIDGQKIKCWRTKGHGSQDFDEGFEHSCNCLFMDIASRLGVDRFYSGLGNFGLTVKTGVDISGEASGLTIPQASVKTVDLARMGFGQAVAVTPIELLVACAAVVNGGKLLTPYLLDHVESGGTTIYRNYPNVKSTVISENTSRQMREVLEKVVSNGSGRHAGVSGYRVGGKTGTAQKYANGIIAQGKYLSSFIGFAPADDPEYIVLMLVDEPKGGVYYGSMVAAPYVGEIFKNIFVYKNILPSVPGEPIEYFTMPSIFGLGYDEAAKVLKKYNLAFEVDGEGGKVVSQVPAEGALVSTKNVVLMKLG